MDSWLGLASSPLAGVGSQLLLELPVLLLLLLELAVLFLLRPHELFLLESVATAGLRLPLCLLPCELSMIETHPASSRVLGSRR